MSASSMAQSLVSILGAGSAFSTAIVSLNDYGILDSMAGCALVVRVSAFSNPPISYGTRRTLTSWEFTIEGFIQDTGDPLTVLNNTIMLSDEVRKLLNANDGLAGSALKSNLARGRMAGGFTLGGHDVVRWDYTVMAEEFA